MKLRKITSAIAISGTIGIGLLFLFEVGLRIWAPSLESRLVREVRYDNFDWYQINRGYLSKYFSSTTPLVPEFKESLFRKEKLPNTFRVFCLGGSTMFGVPYQMNANIPGILRKQLRNAFPEKDIEVVNWGASAINSNAILDLSRELSQFKPDLICIYMGHNEFYGPEGIGASFLEKSVPLLITLKYRVRELRIVRLLSRLLADDKAKLGIDQNLMQQVSGEAKVPLDSDDARWVFEHFGKNLNRLLEFWKGENVALVVSDVSSNLLFPPFAHPDVPKSMIDAVASSTAERNLEGILKLLEPLHKQDSTNAYVEYWIGNSLLGMNRWGSAKPYLVRARDHDLLKFRAPSQINSIIHRVCDEQSVSVITADSLFSSLCANDIPGNELFWEHLHPNVRGYYAIGRAFFECINQNRLVPTTGKISGITPLPYDLNRLSICWLDLAYGDLSIQHLTGRWPFESYKRELAVIDSAQSFLRDIAFATYNRTLVWDEACYRTAEFFWRNGRVEDARTTYEAILEEYPYNFYAHYLLGSLIAKSGSTEEALHHFNLSVQSNRDYPNPRLDAGLLLINAGEFDAAIRILREALPLTIGMEKNSLRANVLYGLAAAYANKENYDEALKNLDQALVILPNYTDAMRLREGIVAQMKK